MKRPYCVFQCFIHAQELLSTIYRRNVYHLKQSFSALNVAISANELAMAYDLIAAELISKRVSQKKRTTLLFTSPWNCLASKWSRCLLRQALMSTPHSTWMCTSQNIRPGPLTLRGHLSVVVGQKFAHFIRCAKASELCFDGVCTVKDCNYIAARD